MRVLVPTVRRVYQPNPASGATTQVTMKADMPWQRTFHVGKPRMQISGLGQGDDSGDMTAAQFQEQLDFQSAASTPAAQAFQAQLNTQSASALPAPAATPVPSFWGGLVNDITKLGTAVAAAEINKTTAPKTTMQKVGAVVAQPMNMAMIMGVVAVLGVGIFFMTRKGGKGGKGRRGRR